MHPNTRKHDKIDRMINKHFYNPEEFYGAFMLPSISRDDPAFEKQKYWKGAIWPPLNFLTYLSLRNAGKFEAASELAENSIQIFMSEWNKKGYVSENYSAITGTGDDTRLSSDKFHSWGSLMGIISFIEKGFLQKTENKIVK